MTLTRPRVLTAAASLFLLGTLALAGGWGPAGHAIIAQIAYFELTPEARAKVDRIMGVDSIQETSAWADRVRGTDDYRWTGPLHYANPSPEHDNYDHARDCPPEGNVVSAVRDFAAIVADESATDLDRKEALMFLVHFVGDLHQPLHAGRAADRGGNDIRVNFFGRERNIHSIWDSGIMDAARDEPWPLWVERLYPEIDSSDRDAWLASGASPDVTTVGRWITESRRLAYEHCYVLEGGETVGEDYVQGKLPVVDECLKQGGVRLGAMLNEIFGE